MSSLLALSPEQLAARMVEIGAHRALFRPDAQTGRVVASHEGLADIADFFSETCDDFHAHEATFLEVGEFSGALYGAFVHDTRRGQGQGGLRHWPYGTVEAFLRDGLRLSRGMTRKNALAGLWWGGGKGIIARKPGDDWQDAGQRAVLYSEYGRFVSSLGGCYITAEDAGTSVEDMRTVYACTRFTTCIPPELGGSGNPSSATAQGVVRAMEAALDFQGKGSLEGKTIAMQGAGNVAGFMIDELLGRSVGRIVATDIDGERLDTLRRKYEGQPVELRKVAKGADAILSEPCDILAPNALGGVLGPQSIPEIQAGIVCGAANNQLLDEHRDAQDLKDRNILYVPDFVANRMGIVNCANEQYGRVADDPDIARHLGRDWENSVFQITQKVLTRAREKDQPTAMAANALADELAAELHPIWGHRQKDVIESLVAEKWPDGEPSAS